jgi:hypothetical protein
MTKCVERNFFEEKIDRTKKRLIAVEGPEDGLISIGQCYRIAGARQKMRGGTCGDRRDVHLKKSGEG